MEQAVQSLLVAIVTSTTLSWEEKDKILAKFTDPNVSNEELIKIIEDLCNKEIIESQENLKNLESIEKENDEILKAEEAKIAPQAVELEAQDSEAEARLVREYLEKVRSLDKELDKVEEVLDSEEGSSKVSQLRARLRGGKSQ